MHTIQLTKNDIKALETLRRHAQRDISYGGGGTFSKGDDLDTPDMKEIRLAMQGIQVLEDLIANKQ